MKKKLFTALLALCMAVALLTSTALAADFSDVDGHWGETAIERWADYGVLNGKGGGKFDPDGTMTRAEFAQMLVNMMGYTKTSTETFTDLDPNQWYADAVSKLVAAGVMNGVGGGRVNPTGKITREEAAVMLCRAFDIKPSGSGSLSFADSGKVSPWAMEAMTALSERGMINGVGGNLLSPDGIVNRATAAQLTSNMVAKYVTSDTVISGETVNGVIVVAKGAKVEIKDSTVTAPIVAESAAVTLTNTKAANVKVEGSNASVTADSKSSVTDVVLAGSAPKADIKGSVSGGVTVAEGSTGVSATLPKDTTVANESGSSVSVNGSTVASGTTATAPGTSSGGGGGGGIYVPSGGNKDPKPPADSENGNPGDKTEDDRDNTTPDPTPDDQIPDKEEQDVPPADDTKTEGVTVPEDKQACTGNHTWGEGEVTDATCTKDGSVKYTCTVGTCGAYYTEKIEMLGHNYYVSASTPATCTTAGSKTEKCANCNDEKTTETAAATGHDFKNGRPDYNETIHYTLCKYCDVKDPENGTAHTLTYSNKTAENHTAKCSGCAYTKTKAHEMDDSKTETVDATCSKPGSKKETCKDCGYVKTTTLGISSDNHSWDKGVCQNDKTHKCPDEAKHEAGKTCGTCGKEVPEEQPEVKECTCPSSGCEKWEANSGKCTCDADEGKCNCVCPNTANHKNLHKDVECEKCTYTGTVDHSFKNGNCEGCDARVTADNCPDKNGHANIPTSETCGTCGGPGEKEPEQPAACSCGAEGCSCAAGTTECADTCPCKQNPEGGGEGDITE